MTNSIFSTSVQDTAAASAKLMAVLVKYVIPKSHDALCSGGTPRCHKWTSRSYVFSLFSLGRVTSLLEKRFRL